MPRLARVVLPLLLASAAAPIGAQETMVTPKKHENSAWFLMVNVKYKPGKLEDAMKIINEQFAPAGTAIGMTGVRVLQHVPGGDWDLTLMFPMAEGPRALEWAVSPEDAKWMTELAKRNKGVPAAMALLGRYTELIERERASMVREQR